MSHEFTNILYAIGCDRHRSVKDYKLSKYTRKGAGMITFGLLFLITFIFRSQKPLS